MPSVEYVNLKPFPSAGTIAEIESLGHYYDLHNMADYVMSIYNTELRIVDLIWRYPSKWYLDNKNIYSGVVDFLEKNDIFKNQRYIALQFKEVTRFEVKPRDPEKPYTEDNCLCQILTYDEKFNENALTFEFQSDLLIVIEADEVSFERDYKFNY